MWLLYPLIGPFFPKWVFSHLDRHRKLHRVAWLTFSWGIVLRLTLHAALPSRFASSGIMFRVAHNMGFVLGRFSEGLLAAFVMLLLTNRLGKTELKWPYALLIVSLGALTSAIPEQWAHLDFGNYFIGNAISVVWKLTIWTMGILSLSPLNLSRSLLIVIISQSILFLLKYSLGVSAIQV